MPATSQTPPSDKCHSFVSKQSAEKHDTPKRISRPPNAFMLYRSNFLKSQAIPPDVEKRQQNLSRIAGQCWNMLPASEKAIWFSKAAVAREEHRAKYPDYTDKGTKRPSAKDKRRVSGHSFGRVRARHTRGAPYCDGMFAALHDSKPLFPESKAGLVSATLFLASPLSPSTLLSPLSLPHVLPPSTFRADCGKANPPPTPDTSPIKSGKFGYPLVSLGSEAPQWGISHVIRNLEIAPSNIDYSFAELEYTPQQCWNDLPYVPDPSLSKPLDVLASQLPLILPSSSIFPSAGVDLADCHPLSSDFNVTDALTHCNQSSVSLYPWYSNISA